MESGDGNALVERPRHLYPSYFSQSLDRFATAWDTCARPWIEPKSNLAKSRSSNGVVPPAMRPPNRLEIRRPDSPNNDHRRDSKVYEPDSIA